VNKSISPLLASIVLVALVIAVAFIVSSTVHGFIKEKVKKYDNRTKTYVSKLPESGKEIMDELNISCYAYECYEYKENKIMDCWIVEGTTINDTCVIYGNTFGISCVKVNETWDCSISPYAPRTDPRKIPLVYYDKILNKCCVIKSSKMDYKCWDVKSMLQCVMEVFNLTVKRS